MTAYLLQNQTENTDGSQVSIPIINTGRFGKYYIVAVHGTFDGAVVSIECSSDEGSTWLSCGTYSTFTSNGVCKIELGPGFYLRASLSNAGLGTNVTSTLH